jgi:hydrogenase maturation factor
MNRSVNMTKHEEASEGFDDPLGLGKVSSEVMRRSVFPFLPMEGTPDLDGGVVRLTGNMVVAHSPSIGVPLEALGFFAFHYAASNVAVRLGTPRHLVTGIYLPLKTREKDLRTIAKGLGEEAGRYGVTIVAGQTATYSGLEIPLLTTTCIGEPVREAVIPRPGDKVLMAGEVGGEAVWLDTVSRGSGGEEWGEFTPLEAALSLQEVEGVRLMHDISEGGVKKALLEIAEARGVGLEVDSSKIQFSRGADKLGQDLLRAPTYGSLLVVVDPGAVADTERACAGAGVPLCEIGVVTGDAGVLVDGEKVGALERIALDEIYGAFKRER